MAASASAPWKVWLQAVDDPSDADTVTAVLPSFEKHYVAGPQILEGVSEEDIFTLENAPTDVKLKAFVRRAAIVASVSQSAKRAKTAKGDEKEVAVAPAARVATEIAAAEEIVVYKMLRDVGLQAMPPAIMTDMSV